MGRGCSNCGEHSCGFHDIFSTGLCPGYGFGISLREHGDGLAIDRQFSTFGLGHLHISSMVAKMCGIVPKKIIRTDTKATEKY
jgi:hypothetical protein